MLIRVWAGKGFNKNARVEIRKCKDGSFIYSLIDRTGRTHDLDSLSEAEAVARQWGMVDATEEFRQAGWLA